MSDFKTYRKYVFVLLLGSVFLLLPITLLILGFERKIPAPRISSSESFNEKARWLRYNASSGCDVLIVGSSIALNNIDGPSIKRAFPDKSLLNVASWGLDVLESKKLLQYITQLCRPKLIIYSTYYGDFDNRSEKTVNWNLFDSYISGNSNLLAYAQTLDLRYYLSTYFNRRSANKQMNRVYQSLLFDSTGSVMLDSEDFEFDESRWNGYKKYKPLDIGNVSASLRHLDEIEKISRQLNSHLIVIKAPLRPEAQMALSRPEIDHLWAKVGRSVSSAGETFIDIPSLAEFSDPEFADFAHLNKKGAAKEVRLIIPVLRNLLRE